MGSPACHPPVPALLTARRLAEHRTVGQEMVLGQLTEHGGGHG